MTVQQIRVDVVGVDGRKRLGSGLADQPEVISKREQVAGFFWGPSRGAVLVSPKEAMGLGRGPGRFLLVGEVLLGQLGDGRRSSGSERAR